VLCVGACVYNGWHRYPPIQIGRLQRYAVEKVFDENGSATLLERAAPTGKRVACVGAGPASLAAAGCLALEGVEVTLFEKRRRAGGLNRTGVAPYKMHAEGALREVEFIRSLGVTIREGVEVGKDVTAEKLLAEHDAVFIGVGLGPDAKLGIPGEDGPDVTGATAWIERMKLEPGFKAPAASRAVVIGGGNTAIDAGRELKRLGVADVAIVYRRGASDMPGYRHELESAHKEGVRLIERAVPKEFVRDGSGRLTALAIEGGRQVSCELALVAIGQAKLKALAAQFPGVALDDKGRIVVDEATGRTGNPKVFAGGDALGGELVVTAAQDAKRAARAICALLGVAVRSDAAMNAGHR